MRKIFVALLLCVPLFCAGAAQAQSHLWIRITNDRGGRIGTFSQYYYVASLADEHFVIDGNCLSACTMLFGLIPKSNVCATPRARFGFHAAWEPDKNGNPVTSKDGTKALWDLYPPALRRWITRHGGLTRKMIYLQGKELWAFVPRCGKTAVALAFAQPTAPSISRSGSAYPQQAEHGQPSGTGLLHSLY